MSGFLGYRGFLPEIKSESRYYDDYLYNHAYHFCKWIILDYSKRYPRDYIALKFVDLVCKYFSENKLTLGVFINIIHSTNKEYDRAKTNFKRCIRISDDEKKLEISFRQKDLEKKLNAKQFEYLYGTKSFAIRHGFKYDHLFLIATLYENPDFDQINYDAWNVENFHDEGFYDDTEADTMEY